MQPRIADGAAGMPKGQSTMKTSHTLKPTTGRNLRTVAPSLIARPVASAALARVMDWAFEGLSDHMSTEEAGHALGLTSRAFAA